MSEYRAEQPALQRLERSRSDRMLAGVSGGLARYFGIHPAFYRVGFVVLALIGGAGILIYDAAGLPPLLEMGFTFIGLGSEGSFVTSGARAMLAAAGRS